MWVWPRTRRNERWASIMPVAIHRFFMSPSPQVLTRPVTTRTVEIIDSMQLVFVNDRRSAPVIPRPVTVNISSSPSSSDPAASGWSALSWAASRGESMRRDAHINERSYVAPLDPPLGRMEMTVVDAANKSQEQEEGNAALSDAHEHVHGPDCDHDHHHPVQQPVRREAAKVGRNDPCICGSGKKFKKCCA